MANQNYVGAIEAFKNTVPNIQRSSLFDVSIPNFSYGSNRTSLANGLTNGLVLKFTVKNASFPEASVGDLTVNYMGRTVHFYGNRTYGGDWSTTVILDGEWRIYDDIYAWNQAMGGANRIVSQDINSHKNFKVDAYIAAYSTDGQIARRAVIHGLWPKSISALSMDWSQDGALDLPVTWTYDYVTLDSNVASDNGPSEPMAPVAHYEGRTASNLGNSYKLNSESSES